MCKIHNAHYIIQFQKDMIGNFFDAYRKTVKSSWEIVDNK